MKRILSILALCSLLLTACNSTPSETTTENDENALCSKEATPDPHLPAGDVLELAQTDEESAEAYKFVGNNDAEIIPVNNDQSYAVWWQPKDFDAAKDTVVVSLHGHGSWATKDFEVWYPQLTQRHMAYLGLQWWFGRSLEDEGYYEPDQVYALISEQLAAKGIPSGHVIFQGFSMGSARSYGVTLFDHLCGENYFGVSIANSGQWEDDYELYANTMAGAYGEKPFEGTEWILYCGEKDYNSYATGSREKDTCQGMSNTKDRLESLGGLVDLFIQDPTGSHGSFMLDADNVNQAMDEAEMILEDE